MFCLPAAHADLTNDFLEQFSERILKQSWSEVAEVAHLRIPALLKNPESEQALADAIALAYGADVSDLHGLSLWAVLRRCAEQPTRFRAGC